MFEVAVPIGTECLMTAAVSRLGRAGTNPTCTVNRGYPGNVTGGGRGCHCGPVR